MSDITIHPDELRAAIKKIGAYLEQRKRAKDEKFPGLALADLLPKDSDIVFTATAPFHGADGCDSFLRVHKSSKKFAFPSIQFSTDHESETGGVFLWPEDHLNLVIELIQLLPDEILIEL